MPFPLRIPTTIGIGPRSLAGACEVLRLAGVERCSPVTKERRADRALARGNAAASVTAAGSDRRSQRRRSPSRPAAARAGALARPRRHGRQQIRHRVDRHRVLAQLEVQVRAGRRGRSSPRSRASCRRSRSGRRTPRCATCARTRWRSRAGAGPPPGSRSRRCSSPRTRRRRRPAAPMRVPEGTGKSMPVWRRPPSRRGAEAVADRSGHRPKQPHRAADRRRATGRPPRCSAVPQRARSCWARPGRRRQPVRALEVPQGRVGHRAEHRVDRSGRVAAPREDVLHRRDVPPAVAALHGPRAEGRPAALAERASASAGPTTPSTARPRRRWKCTIAALVNGPLTPSTVAL